jgi:hypothetical protein
MAKRKQTAIAVAVLTLLALQIWLVGRWAMIGGFSREEFTVTWQQRSGPPLEVSGKVVDSAGKPIANLPIDLDTMSGPACVETGPDGTFEAELGEPDLTGIRIGAWDPVDLRPPLGVSAHNGLHLDIVTYVDPDDSGS